MAKRTTQHTVESRIGAAEAQPFDIDDRTATRLYAIFEDIRANNNGVLRPKDVLAAATTGRWADELADYFDWNDQAAANKYRLDQARKLIRVVRLIVLVDGKPHVEANAYEHVQVSETHYQGGTYVPLIEAVRRPDYRQQLLAKAVQEIERWKAKYAQLEELGDIFEAVVLTTKRLRPRLKKKPKKAKKKKPAKKAKKKAPKKGKKKK